MYKRGEIKLSRIFLLVGLILFVSVFLIQLTSSISLSDETKGRILEENIGKYELRILEEFDKLKTNETKMGSVINNSEEYFILDGYSGSSDIEFSEARNETFLDIQIYLKDKSEADNLFSSFSEDEVFDVLNRPISEVIGARVTEEGFYKLIQDDRVDRVYYNRPLYFELDESKYVINATIAWEDLNYTGDGIKVCVIDSGVDASHPDLAGKIVSEKCYCRDNCCSGGTDESNDATDTYGHGTRVIGIIASQNLTYKGIAHNASIYAVKIGLSIDSLDVDGSAAVDWCISQGVDVISMSLGDHENYPDDPSCPTAALANSVASAYNNGISVIVASGNNGYDDGISYPACSPNAISVGATYDDNLGFWDSLEYEFFDFCWNFANTDEITCFSNTGSNLDLLAPGCRITSTEKGGGFGIGSGELGRCGTSYSAPHVSGAVALMLERDPNLTPDEIKTILQDTGKQISSWSRINVSGAIESICTSTAWSAGGCGGSCDSNERQYTRTATPSACEDESECREDTSCLEDPGPGNSEEITVCSSGCDYTVIQTAVDNSDSNDKILVTDSGTYDEEIVMNSTTSGWLDCQDGAKISKAGGGGVGVFVNDVGGPVILNCYITGFEHGIYLNASYGIIQNNTLADNEIGLQLKGNRVLQDNDIINNYVQNNTIYGIYFYAYSWAKSHTLNHIENNNFENNDPDGIFMWMGLTNVVRNNSVSGSSQHGIYIDGENNNVDSYIDDNIIFDNVNGLLLETADHSEFNRNVFCSSSTSVDIDIMDSESIDGADNNCEVPGGWNDTGTMGCTYYCDSPPNVTLLSPFDGSSDTDGDVDFTCHTEDNYYLTNVTLYHNLSGSWTANQTEHINGTSNTTTFTINNIPNATSILWNCLATDNQSRVGYAKNNWTMDIHMYYDIESCRDITKPGTYTSQNNIANASREGCINIQSDNVTLDCQNYMIDGDGSQDYGIYIHRNSSTDTNITIKNCIVTDWNGTGIWFENASKNKITDVSVSNNVKGVYLLESSNINISDSVLANNTDSDFMNEVYSDEGCSNVLDNVIGTDDKQIVYYNETVTIEGWNNNVSEIILCNADNSIIRNVNLSHSDMQNNMINLLRTDYTNITNVNTNNLWRGISEGWGEGNRIVNSSFNNSGGYSAGFGTFSWISNYTRIVYATISNSTDVGISFVGSNNTFVSDSFISENSGGAYIGDSMNTTITSSQLYNNSVGLTIVSYGLMGNSSDNVIYNNLFNNTDNIGLYEYLGGAIKYNMWNITKTSGSSIIGSINIGGNYWAYPNGTGFSETCDDLLQDGICDDTLTLEADNIDYLPLTAVPPNDPSKFSIKNVSNSIVAWLGDLGNIVLKGSCYSGPAACTNPGADSFIVKNSTDHNVGYVNSTGDLCIVTGDCSDQNASCNSPADGAFIIRNSTDGNMSYIDFDGDLCLTGSLYENSL